MLGQIFFISGFFSDLGSGEGEGGERKRKSSENDQLTGHFQSFFISFSERFFNI